jgi:Coenzyme PQQ synthesis protein D (PqqD)
MEDETTIVPKAKLMILRQLKDEFLLYDQKSKKAHCLNRVAADVWLLCDGNRTVAQIIRQLQGRAKSPIDENVVRFTLRRLQRAGLLESGAGKVELLQLPSRRLLVKKLGVAAAAAVPIVTSILVPTPAEAASPCRNALQPCPQGNTQCCSGLCVAGQCL